MPNGAPTSEARPRARSVVDDRAPPLSACSDAVLPEAKPRPEPSICAAGSAGSTCTCACYDESTRVADGGTTPGHPGRQRQRPLLLILDCRSRSAARGNSVLGKGTESEAHYRSANARLVFLDMVNIHAVRRRLRTAGRETFSQLPTHVSPHTTSASLCPRPRMYLPHSAPPNHPDSDSRPTNPSLAPPRDTLAIPLRSPHAPHATPSLSSPSGAHRVPTSARAGHARSDRCAAARRRRRLLTRARRLRMAAARRCPCQGWSGRGAYAAHPPPVAPDPLLRRVGPCAAACRPLCAGEGPIASPAFRDLSLARHYSTVARLARSQAQPR